MKILAMGDVVGKAGRRLLLEKLPYLKKKLALDFIVVNGENAAHGFGISEKMVKAFLNAGVDVVTLGNHTWDQKEIIKFIDAEPRLVRPMNYPLLTPGKGYYVATLADGRRVAVLQLLGNLFFEGVDNAFTAVQKWLEKNHLGKDVDAILLDFHAEATSEKMAMGHICDGLVSLVFGTHTHIPTADAMILPKGTGYISDLGMCGDYNSVIGMQAGEAVRRFVTGIKTEHLEPAEKSGTICGVYVETDDKSGLAVKIEQVIIGATLANRMPL
jgi:hypothetical protein